MTFAGSAKAGIPIRSVSTSRRSRSFFDGRPDGSIAKLLERTEELREQVEADQLGPAAGDDPSDNGEPRKSEEEHERAIRVVAERVHR